MAVESVVAIKYSFQDEEYNIDAIEALTIEAGDIIAFEKTVLSARGPIYSLAAADHRINCS